MSDKPSKVPPKWDEMSEAGLEAMERYARHVMEAAAKTQALIAGADPSKAARPVDADPFNIGPEATEVWGKLAADPETLAEAQMKLWQGYMSLWTSTAKRIASGESAPAVTPEKGDKRWRSEDWEANPFLDLVKQSYLLTSQWLLDTVSSVDGVDDATKKKVAFFTRQMADAFSPTNFALTNPEVMRAAAESGGENFVKGMKNLAEDLARGKGRLAIKQTDLEKFEVGRDVAATAGSVIFQNRIFQLIQYLPTTAQTYERPLLIFPPWINKFYILDLRPENSMVRWLLDQGYPVYLVSWVNPRSDLADVTFDDYYREGILEAVEKTIEQSGCETVNTVGYCIGGTLLSAALAHMGQHGDARIQSATFFAAQADFSEAGDLLLFVDDEWLEEISRRMDEQGGVLDGATMSETFNMLRANDLVWSFMINNYLMGKDPKAFDLLFWNSDQTRLPKALHLYYLKQFYRKNALAKGKLKVAGDTVSLGDIKTPAYFQASREDHIAPYPSVFKSAKQFGGPTKFTLAGSGHIAGVINHPDAEKYQHWTNSAKKLPDTVDAWLAEAKEKPGSWWPHWDKWLSKKSGELVDAKTPADGPLKPIEPAPGSYVKDRGD